MSIYRFLYFIVLSCSVTKVAHVGIITLQLVIFILIYNRKKITIFFVSFAFNFAAILFSKHQLDVICIPLHSYMQKA